MIMHTIEPSLIPTEHGLMSGVGNSKVALVLARRTDTSTVYFGIDTSTDEVVYRTSTTAEWKSLADTDAVVAIADVLYSDLQYDDMRLRPVPVTHIGYVIDDLYDVASRLYSRGRHDLAIDLSDYADRMWAELMPPNPNDAYGE